MQTHFYVRANPDGSIAEFAKYRGSVTLGEGWTETLSGPPPKPSGHLTMTLVNGAIGWSDLRTLEQVKSAKWEEIKAARAVEEYSPLTVGSWAFDANQESQQKIAGAVQLALIAPADWTTSWTLTDNSVVELSKAQMIGVGVALGQRTSEIYGKARTIRSQINLASREELSGISW